MASFSAQSVDRRAVWALVERQHGVISGPQLFSAGFSRPAIKHRLESGRLHRLHRDVYAVGRPELTRLGELMAAVLVCGPGAVLSHASAGEVLGICPAEQPIHVSVPPARSPRAGGIEIHRRTVPDDERGMCQNLSVTSPARTLCDLGCHLPPPALERAVNEADRLDLIDPEALREAIEAMAGRPGVRALRNLLDRRTFTLTDSELERRFKLVAKTAGLPLPQTGGRLNGFKVDFYWPDLGLVVETDGLRYHRTAAQQTRALERDQVHYAAGLTPLRFSHAQIVYRKAYVQTTLTRARIRIEHERGGAIDR